MTSNPANPVSREYELRIVDELSTNYDFDGIVFDRMRYASLQSDFSELSRLKFEEYLGQKTNRWPGDVYTFDPTPGRGMILGPYYKQWLEWRARNIRTWLEDANKIVRTKRPNAKIGVYVGSWYNTYYTVGVNWWMTPNVAMRINWERFTYDDDVLVGANNNNKRYEDCLYIRWQIDF